MFQYRPKYGTLVEVTVDLQLLNSTDSQFKYAQYHELFSHPARIAMLLS